MNQQSANSSITNNSSVSSNLSSLATAGERPKPNEAATPDAPLPTAVTRNSKSPAAASVRRTAAKSTEKNEDRCRHYTATGHRCRLSALDPASGLCFRHVGLPFQPTDEDLSPAFGALR